ncbi:MAG: hypothetical protein ACE364_08085 [Chlorobiota bacterium]
MKLKKILLLILILFQSIQLISSEIWSARYGGSRLDVGKTLFVNDDNSVVIAGWTNSPEKRSSDFADNNDIYVVKLDKDGNLLWELSLGGTKEDIINSMDKCSNGGYIFTGYSGSIEEPLNAKGSRDLLLFKVNEDGKLVWCKSYGGKYFEEGNKIICTKNGGFIVAGISSSSNGDIAKNYKNSRDIWIVKFDISGSIEWQSTYGGSMDDWAIDMIETFDGNYLILGNTSSFDYDLEDVKEDRNQDVILIKIDPYGNKLWQKVYQANGIEYAQKLYETKDSSILFSVQTDSDEGLFNERKGGKYDVGLVKTDYIGEVIWSKVYGGNGVDGGGEICEDLQNNIHLSFISNSVDGDINKNNGFYDIVLFKLDTEGSIISKKIIGGNDFESINDAKIKNNQLILVGYTQSIFKNGISIKDQLYTGKGSADIWLIKKRIED